MDKIYRVKITEVDPETKEERVLDEDEYSGFTLLATNIDGTSSCEIMMHDSLMNLAAKIAASKKACSAAKLAVTLMNIKDDANASIEDSLLDAIGGIQ